MPSPYGTYVDSQGRLQRRSGVGSNPFDFEFRGGTGFPEVNQPTQFGNNLFSDFFEERPDIPYAGALYGRGSDLTPNERDYFRNQRSNIMQRFLAQLYDQLEGGELPTARVTDFLRDFDFSRAYRDATRGNPGRFVPLPRVLR